MPRDWITLVCSRPAALRRRPPRSGALGRAGEHALDLGDERVGKTRLGDEGIAPRLAGAFRVPRQRVTRQRDDRNVLASVRHLQPPGGFPPVHLGQREVHQDDVGHAARSSSRSPRCRWSPRRRGSRRTAGTRRTSRARPGSPRRRARAGRPAPTWLHHRRRVSAGSRNVKVDPSPGTLSRSIVPPSICASRRQIDRPRPGAAVAAGRRAVELPKILEDLALVLRPAIPTPVSLTAIDIIRVLAIIGRADGDRALLA